MYLVIHNCTVVGEFEDYTQVYEELIDNEKKSDSLCPMSQFVNDIEYTIEEVQVSESSSETKLVKIEKMYNKGYLYSTMSSRNTILSTIQIHYLKDKDTDRSNESLEVKLTDKLNERIIKSLDRDSLVQLLLTFKETKDVNAISILLASHKKHMYSVIAEKLKRFGVTSKQD